MPFPGFHYFGTLCPEVLKAGGILGAVLPFPGFHYFGTLCPEVLKAGGILVVPPGQRYNDYIGANRQQK